MTETMQAKITDELMEKAKQAKQAAGDLAKRTAEEKNKALHAIASQLLTEQPYLLAENERDLADGRAAGMDTSLLDRLALDKKRLEDMAAALLQVAALPDPIGETVMEWQRPNGLRLSSVRVPLGVIGMIYEARPNVTVDAASLCLKTGNAVLLRGSSSAIHSNKALVCVIHRALEQCGIPAGAVQLLEDTSRKTAAAMFRLNEYLDVLIPRGSAKLIQTVVEQASVPVLETGAGNCHLYIDRSADPGMAISIAVNAKTQRPSVCNACETILVHEQWAASHLSELVNALQQKGVQLYGDETVQKVNAAVLPASEKDWETEYLGLQAAMKAVSSTDEAIAHISRYGTRHSEAIVSRDEASASKFLAEVDAAAVYHNASTRFTDGFEFGFGAEIGISTQKLHARGPMGLPALTSTKTVIRGTGQIK